MFDEIKKNLYFYAFRKKNEDVCYEYRVIFQEETCFSGNIYIVFSFQNIFLFLLMSSLKSLKSLKSQILDNPRAYTTQVSIIYLWTMIVLV